MIFVQFDSFQLIVQCILSQEDVERFLGTDRLAPRRLTLGLHPDAAPRALCLLRAAHRHSNNLRPTHATRPHAGPLKALV
jgi:hypothetical protein